MTLAPFGHRRPAPAPNAVPSAVDGSEIAFPSGCGMFARNLLGTYSVGQFALRVYWRARFTRVDGHFRRDTNQTGTR